MNIGPSLMLFTLAVLTWSVAGCASVAESDDNGGQALETEECISQEGQRFLTFCASKEAAELARRQHVISVADSEEESAADMVPLSVDRAPVRGEREAPVAIHLFSDLSCSDCRAVYRRLATEVDTRPGALKLIFRHVPTDAAGEGLARSAIAAAEQGKFWEFVDELYADEEMPEEHRWSEVAESAGLDVERWQQDRRTSMIDAILEGDAIEAQRAGVVGAPTFFINGNRQIGREAIRELDDLLGDETEHVEAMEDAGLAGAQISWRRILQNYTPVDWDEVERAEEELKEELIVDYVPVGASPQKGAAAHETLVTVVVFADFECSYCAESAEVWNELAQRYAADGLRVVFRHFPLPIHEGSEMAAAASVLARKVGAFWEFHDALFLGDVAARDDEVEAKLRELGWDGENFGAAVRHREVREVIDHDLEIAHRAGVDGTPTIFINGIKLMGVWSVDELAPLVEDQLQLSLSVQELTGSSGEDLYRDVVEANK